MIRAIFSDAARTYCAETDAPIRAVDPVTGLELIYRFEEARGGVLTCYGGPLGSEVCVSRAVDLDALNTVASQLCDDLARQQNPAPRSEQGNKRSTSSVPS